MALVTIKFDGIWKLYVGTDKATVEAANIDEALAKVREKFATKFEERLSERGIILDGGVLEHSYITLNRENVEDIKEHALKDGDIVDIVIPVPGG